MFFFKHPFTCIVAGPSQSGKTCLINKIVNNVKNYISPKPTRIIWCYGEYTKNIDNLPIWVEKHQGIYDCDSLNSTDTNLLILDDLMSEASSHNCVQELFTR